MDILKAIINKIGTPYPVGSTIAVMVLAGFVWVVLLRTFGSSPTEASNGPDKTSPSTVTNTTNAPKSPIIMDNHGHIDIKGQQNPVQGPGKPTAEQQK
jgi:hypothetical protein